MSILSSLTVQLLADQFCWMQFYGDGNPADEIGVDHRIAFTDFTGLQPVVSHYVYQRMTKEPELPTKCSLFDQSLILAWLTNGSECLAQNADQQMKLFQGSRHTLTENILTIPAA